MPTIKKNPIKTNQNSGEQVAVPHKNSPIMPLGIPE
jgi:hypothetical protein